MKKIQHINIQSIAMMLILLLLAMLCGDADRGTIINVIIILLFGITVFKILISGNVERKALFSYTIKWNFFFFILCLASVLWSINQQDSLDMSFVMFKRFLIIFSIVMNVRNKEQIIKILKYYLIACTYMMLRITYYYLIKGETSSKMWDLACGNYFNTVSQLLAIAIIIAFYLLRKEKNSKYMKVVYSIFMAFSMWHIYITGSRKGLLMPIIELFVYLMLKNRKSMVKIVRTIFVMLTIGGIFIFFLSKNEQLWNRMIILLDAFLAGDALDESSQLRSYFIHLASTMFANRPILGNGINSFVGILYSKMGKSMYSHNNYLEIASSLGIVGIVTYYSYYVYLIKGFISNMKFGEINILGLSIILTLTVFEYGIVTYSVLIYPIILTFLGLIIETNKYEESYIQTT